MLVHTCCCYLQGPARGREPEVSVSDAWGTPAPTFPGAGSNSVVAVMREGVMREPQGLSLTHVFQTELSRS